MTVKRITTMRIGVTNTTNTECSRGERRRNRYERAKHAPSRACHVSHQGFVQDFVLGLICTHCFRKLQLVPQTLTQSRQYCPLLLLMILVPLQQLVILLLNYIAKAGATDSLRNPEAPPAAAAAAAAAASTGAGTTHALVPKTPSLAQDRPPPAAGTGTSGSSCC
jgi:hypothetical protein